MTATKCAGSVRFNAPRSSGQRRRNHNATGVSVTQAIQMASCHRNVRQAGLNIPGGGALRRIRGNSTRNVPAENTPNASQSRKNEIQIVPRLRRWSLTIKSLLDGS
jgi:hypothetical protein